MSETTTEGLATPAADADTPLRFTYRNWRGEVAERRAIGFSVHWGSTEWHPEEQWLLRAYDVDKKAWRDFALKDCDFLRAPLAQAGWQPIETAPPGMCRAGFWGDDGEEWCEDIVIISPGEIEVGASGTIYRRSQSPYTHWQPCIPPGRTPTPPAAEPPSEARVADAARDVLAERERKKAVEGWTPEHDDVHYMGELARAAVCYADPLYTEREQPPAKWPWDASWWKPKDRRRDLVRAAALILAEIERLDRAALSPTPEESRDAER